jgi:hypothetical protein
VHGQLATKAKVEASKEAENVAGLSKKGQPFFFFTTYPRGINEIRPTEEGLRSRTSPSDVESRWL